MDMRYQRLKLKMLLLVALGSLVVGGLCLLVLGALADGPLSVLARRVYLWAACSLFGQTEVGALRAYTDFITEHQDVLYAAGMFVVMLIAFYVAMGRFTRWLDQVRTSMHRIVEDQTDSVKLPGELAPMEEDLNTIRLQLLHRAETDRQNECRRQDLISFLAHDLKTPLTSVVGYLTLLSEGPELSPEERSRYTGIALEKAQRLEELLGEFFDITRMDLKTQEKEHTRIQMSILLEQLADEFYPLFLEKQLECSVDIQPHLTVMGDPDKLARVFDNVLRNAVNYSCQGGHVDISAKCSDGNVEVSIRNEGLEIPEGELANIFEKFYRLDTARSTRTGGAGLGLAIAREIVELHGGTIRAESNGRFTSFLITLPASDDADAS